MTETMPPEFWLGVEAFNRLEFYACHDILEALWMEAGEPDRSFYQGVLQIAVALYHLHNHNLKGAVILLGEGTNRLRRYQPVYGEIQVGKLIAQSADLLGVLQHMSPDAAADCLAQLTQGKLLVPTIHRISNSEHF